MKRCIFMLSAFLMACTAQIQRVTTAEEQADDLIASFDSWAAAHETFLATAHALPVVRHAALALFRAHKTSPGTVGLVLGSEPAISRALACLDAVRATAPGADLVAQTCTADLKQALNSFEDQERNIMPVLLPMIDMTTHDAGRKD